MGVGAPWYPDAQPDELRRAARAYRDLAVAIGEAAATAAPGMRSFFAANRTDMLVPYRQAWTALADSGSCPDGYMGQLAQGCQQMATGLEQAADGIDELRGKIDALVAGGAVVTVAAGILTFGIGSAVAGAATAGTVATTTALVISTFLTRVAIVAAFEFVGGYLTDLALQTMSQSVFEPGRPIDLDQGHALKMGGIGAAIGGPLYAAPGAYRLFSNTRALSGLTRGQQLFWSGRFGAMGEARMALRMQQLGESRLLTQLKLYGPTGRLRNGSIADGLLPAPGPAARALFPPGDWRIALLESKNVSTTAPMVSHLTAPQRRVLLQLNAQGGRMSGPLAEALGLPAVAGQVLRPGEVSQMVVFMTGRPDILLRMPVSLREVLREYKVADVLGGAAGPTAQRQLVALLRSLPVTPVPVP